MSNKDTHAMFAAPNIPNRNASSFFAGFGWPASHSIHTPTSLTEFRRFTDILMISERCSLGSQVKVWLARLYGIYGVVV